MIDQLQFAKISATGNDFILFDNREKVFSGEERDAFRRLCRRHFSVGADGVILIENSEQADFRYRHFNSDGSIAEMCGNGARGVALYAYTHGLASADMSFEVDGVLYSATVHGDSVKITMAPPRDLRLDLRVANEILIENGGFVNIGVPHLVFFAANVDGTDVRFFGRRYRRHSAFQPRGTNVNFVQILGESELKVRTYERGVEDETLSCGTGTVASAIIAHLKKEIIPPVHVFNRGGELCVNFDRDFSHVTLEGKAEIVFYGSFPEGLDVIPANRREKDGLATVHSFRPGNPAGQASRQGGSADR